LSRRTNNALIEGFNVNSLNELTTEANGGTLTVAGTSTGPATSVTVSGTGLSSDAADRYADNTWARAGANWVNGNNSYTATATDSYGRSDTETINCNLQSTNYFLYDSNGNLRTNGDQVLAYDDENQLVSVWVTNSWRSDFLYDGLMRRRIRREYTWQSGIWIPQSETQYVYDGMLVIQQRDTNNLPTVTYTRGRDLSGTFEGAGGIGGLLARTDNPLLITGDVTAHAYYHADGSGNITALINTNEQIVAAYSYDAFGGTSSDCGPLASANLYRFSSKEFHPNGGLYYYGYRFHSPGLQRWLSADPVGERGGVNRYSFLGNSVLLFVDPLGLWRAGQCVKGVAGLAGGIALTALGVGLSETGVGIPIAISGTLGIDYGIGNIVASFAPESPATKAMEGYPKNLGGVIGAAVSGQKGKSVGSGIENGIEMAIAHPDAMADLPAHLESLEHFIDSFIDSYESNCGDENPQ
jgi:RHS repeat-associated protein